jgi:hypothetical protein
MKVVNLEYTDIPVLLPPIDFFIDKIKNDEPFHFLRVNHGILDLIHLGYKDISEFEGDFINEDFEAIANKMIAGSELDKYNNPLKTHHENSEKLEEKIIIFLKVLKNNKRISKKIDISASLGVGLGTFWGVWNAGHKFQIGRKVVWEIINKYKINDFYYSGTLKHYSIKREIYKLFDYINKQNYQVIFLGPEYLYLYEDVFKIINFKHIVIPTTNAIEKFDENIEEILKIYQECDKKTIVFHSCGHILSFYLADRLRDTDIFGMDIGRSFDILIKNHIDTESTMPKCWATLSEINLTEYVDNTRKSSWQTEYTK